MVEEIKRRVSLRDTFDALGVVVKGQKALCPLHQDKTPSLSIDDRKGLWYCFVCGVGGSQFDIVMKVENLSFKESLSWFNEKFSLGLTNKRYKPDPMKEALRESYENLKKSFETDRNKLIQHYHFLLSIPRHIWFGMDYNFEFCYHDKLDVIDEKLRALEDVRYER